MLCNTSDVYVTCIKDKIGQNDKSISRQEFLYLLFSDTHYDTLIL